MMPANVDAGQFFVPDQLTDIFSRYVQEVCSLLRSEQFVDGNNRNHVAFGQNTRGKPEGVEQRLRQHDRGFVGSCQLWCQGSFIEPSEKAFDVLPLLGLGLDRLDETALTPQLTTPDEAPIV